METEMINLTIDGQNIQVKKGTTILEAAKTAKIDDSVFPWKITMKINTEKVEVSEGYNKPYETIYKKCKVTKTKKYN